MATTAPLCHGQVLVAHISYIVEVTLEGGPDPASPHDQPVMANTQYSLFDLAGLP